MLPFSPTSFHFPPSFYFSRLLDVSGNFPFSFPLTHADLGGTHFFFLGKKSQKKNPSRYHLSLPLSHHLLLQTEGEEQTTKEKLEKRKETQGRRKGKNPSRSSPNFGEIVLENRSPVDSSSFSPFIATTKRPLCSLF